MVALGCDSTVAGAWRLRPAQLIVALALWASAPSAALAADAPDLVLELRHDPYPGQVAPVYVDAFEEPGRLLYRFDAILRNRGGTLDLYRDAATGSAMQAVWASGEPSEAPDPNRPPSSPDATVTDLGPRGASFAYVFEKTHNHWHFFREAGYALEGPDGTRRASDKIGFCLFDSFGDAGGGSLYFAPGYMGSGSQTWCGFGHPDGDFVRMGLSPGAASRYASQREFQWIDIAGLRPGVYTLRATANPDGSIVESDLLDNVVVESRAIPGVLAAGLTVRRTDAAPLRIGLSGEVIAPGVPARRAADCDPDAASTDCYIWAAADGPLRFRIVRQAQHGTVAISDAVGTRATAVYTPAEGYTGSDSFEYTATDERGLESPLARVEIEGPAAAPAPPAPVPAVEPVLRRLVAGLAVRRRGGRWHAIVRLDAPARVRGRLERRDRPDAVPRSVGRRAAGRRPYRLVRTIRPHRRAAGRRRIALGRLEPGRYRLRLRFAAADGRRAVVRRRFRVRTTVSP